MAYPDYFTCPISLDIFTDPVTLCTGHTYDRPYIEKWLAAGNLTCPVTMQKLHDISLVPNHTLRQLINQWLQTTTWPSSSQHYQYRGRSISSEMQRSFSFDDGTTMLSGSGFDMEVLLPSLKRGLESKEFGQSFEILKSIRGGLLVDGCEEHRDLFRFGFISLVLNLVFGGEKLEEKYYESSEEMQLLLLEVIEEALCFAVKLLLPFNSSELACLNVVLKEEEDTSRINNLASKVKFLLRQGTQMMKVSLCTVIESVITSLSNGTKELLFNTVINNDAEIVGVIINLLLDDDVVDDEEIHESGIKVLSALLLLLLSSSSSSSTTDLHTSVLETLIIRDRVIDLLINYILRSSSQGRKIKNDKASSQATKALEGIISIEKGKQTLIDNPNGIRAFVKMVFKVSDDHQGSESAVNSLIILCCDSVSVREEAIRRGVLTQLLLLIQSQCNVKTKTKARMLLKLLRSMWR